MPEKPSYEQLEKRIRELERAESERKIAVEALRESEARFRLLYERAPVGYQSLDGDGQFIEVNQAWLDTFGYKKEEVIGKSFSEFLHPDWADHFKHNFPRFKAVGEILGVEFEMVKKNGSTIWVSFNGRVVKDRYDNFQQTHCVLHDITEQRTAEQAIHESEEKYRRLAEECPISIMTFDHSGMVTFVNKWHLEKFAGGKHPASFFVGQKITELPGIVGAGVADALGKVFEGRHVVLDCVYFPFFTGGHAGYQSIKAVPIYKDGQFVSGILIREDVTGQKLAEEALKESEAKYRVIMESMNDPIYICSADFRVEYMNPAMIKMAGRHAIGESCHNVIHGLDEKCPTCIHQKVMAGESITREVELLKENRTFSVSNSPIFHADGSVSKLTVFRDVTNVKIMENCILQSQKLEAIGTLAGGIAHDFNNILSAVIGYTEIALDDEMPLDAPARNSLENVLKAGLRAKDLVKQILAFSRQTQYEKKPISLGPIVQEVLKLIRASLPTNIEIRQRGLGGGSTVFGDPIQIHQVLMNLCTNAGHAMRNSGGLLEVGLSRVEYSPSDITKPMDVKPGAYVELTVADSGPGMSPTVREQIFNPFFTTKAKEEGTGLGLSVAHGIVKEHDGAIRVDSQPGAGTTFSIFLPLLADAKETDAAPEEPLPPGTERILVVDDEKAIANVSKMILERLGYRVTAVSSSLDALDRFAGHPADFDLVITDQTMPVITGDQLALKIWALRPDIPVILCTGFSHVVDEVHARKIGIRDFIMKPVVRRDLAVNVRRVLDEG
ncbi:PAS domain-containing hybrid sensor histidine kinase/response regulator [Desulfosarcina alkanivorans]|nr:PAS domain S-box protein [Desulfosarcina alkanivorans]